MSREEYPRDVLLRKLFAFLGRYGHQDIATLRKMTYRELDLLSREVATLLEQEYQALSPPT